MHNLGCCSKFQGSRLMDRALTGGIGAGTTLAIGLELLRGLEHRAPISPSDLCLPPLQSWWDIHTGSLIFGLIIGLLLGPLIEALVALRFWIYQQTLTRLGGVISAGGSGRPAFRVC